MITNGIEIGADKNATNLQTSQTWHTVSLSFRFSIFCTTIFAPTLSCAVVIVTFLLLLYVIKNTNIYNINIVDISIYKNLIFYQILIMSDQSFLVAKSDKVLC